jgi:hypothetical protein
MGYIADTARCRGFYSVVGEEKAEKTQSRDKVIPG